MTKSPENEKAPRRKPKWSSKTLHKRRRMAMLKNSASRIVVNPSRMRNFTKQ